MRRLFADGMNSFWHFAFGFLGAYWWAVLPGFIIYQYFDIAENNVRIDLAECFIGFLAALALIQTGVIPDNRGLFSKMGGLILQK